MERKLEIYKSHQLSEIIVGRDDGVEFHKNFRLKNKNFCHHLDGLILFCNIKGIKMIKASFKKLCYMLSKRT